METPKQEISVVGLVISCDKHEKQLFPVECEAQDYSLVAVCPIDLDGQVLASGMHRHCRGAKHHFAGEVLKRGPLICL